MKVKKLFEDQNYFSKMIGTVCNTSEDLDNFTKTLSLALHKEVSDLVSATNYRSHTDDSMVPDADKILFESVDVIRYAVAIMNAWSITPEKFQKAWILKDKYLSLSRKIEGNTWKGEKVAIVDMDDVLCEFRVGFSNWLNKNYSVITDVESKEYYFINALEKAGINPEGIFLKFVSEDGFSSLKPASGAIDFIKSLQEKGYFIHILTARPGDNLRCLYNTLDWLDSNNVCFDKVSFSSEKLRWCMQSEYWSSGAIEFAIDDSPKHAAEYAKHDIRVLLPRKTYNTEVQSLSNVIVYDSFLDIDI